MYSNNNSQRGGATKEGRWVLRRPWIFISIGNNNNNDIIIINSSSSSSTTTTTTITIIIIVVIHIVIPLLLQHKALSLGPKTPFPLCHCLVGRCLYIQVTVLLSFHSAVLSNFESEYRTAPGGQGCKHQPKTRSRPKTAKTKTTEITRSRPKTAKTKTTEITRERCLGHPFRERFSGLSQNSNFREHSGSKRTKTQLGIFVWNTLVLTPFLRDTLV